MDKSTVREVKKKASLVKEFRKHTKLQRRGGKTFAVCPFHWEKTASLHIDSAKGLWYCHGCGTGGDVFNVVMNLNNMTFPEALRYLGIEYGVEVSNADMTPAMKEKTLMRRALEVTAAHYRLSLGSDEGRDACDYLESRGITAESVRQWNIGYAPHNDTSLTKVLDDQGLLGAAASAGVLTERGGQYTPVFTGRVTFPIRDKIGRMVSFAGRDLSGKSKAKYINGRETSIYKKSDVLYGLNQAIEHIRENEQVILVEGYFDVIALHQQEFTEAVALCGTALTKQHVQLFSTIVSEAICCFDGDDAGRRAAEKSLPLLAEQEIRGLSLTLDDGTDPFDLAMTKTVAELVDWFGDRTEPLLRGCLRLISKRHDNTAQGRQSVVREVVPILRSYPPTVRSTVVREASIVLGIPYMALKGVVGSPLSLDMGRSVGPAEDPVVNALLDVLLNHRSESLDPLKHLELSWLDGEEADMIELMLDEPDLHQVTQECSEHMRKRLHRISVEPSLISNPQAAVSSILVRLELRCVEEHLAQGVDERLMLQKLRLKLIRKLKKVASVPQKSNHTNANSDRAKHL